MYANIRELKFIQAMQSPPNCGRGLVDQVFHLQKLYAFGLWCRASLKLHLPVWHRARGHN